MKETFIERAKEYPIEYGKLVIYESNTTCESIAFKFDHHVITIMLAGQKSVLAEGKRFEFFPGTFLIPQKNIIHNVKIPVASEENPTLCLELDLSPTFIKEYYEEICNTENIIDLLHIKHQNEQYNEYISNDSKLIELLKRMYKRRIMGDNKGNQMIVSLMVKELLIDLFQTSALHLLMDDLHITKLSKPIKEALEYINENLDKKISVNELSEFAGIGLTSFFNKFKEELNITPADYIAKQRINLAKSYLKNGGYSLKDAAYSCGFKSYEHFCARFKKFENMTPSKYLKST